MTLVSEKEIDTLNNMALEVGELLLTLYDEESKITQKGKHDFTTNADIQSEKLIISRVKESQLPYIVIAEEKLDDVNFPLRLGDEGILYVDPLEGTHNFARKRKEFGFGVTLGLVKNNQPTYVVFYNPVTKELYKAIKNGGTYLNGGRIHVSNRKTNLDIIFNHWPDKEYVGEYLDKLRGGRGKITDYTPTSCSDAVDICMVARGSVDGLVFVFEEAAPWDLITALFIEEAGGKVTNIKGNSWYTINRRGFMEVRNSMIAGNPYTHQMLLNLYNPSLK